jgi:diguanylate cyclase (GGDEF)-like protein
MVSPETIRGQASSHNSRGVRFVVALVLLFIAVLWSFVAYWAISSRQERVGNAEQMLLRTNHAVEEQTRRLLTMLEVFFGVADQWMLDNPNADPGRDPRFLRLVDNFRMRSGGAIDVHLADAAGNIIALSSGGNAPREAIGEADYFRAATSGDLSQLHIGAPVAGGSDGAWQIPVAHRLARGKGAAVLVAGIELSSLLALYEDVRLRPDGTVTLLRQDGVLLAQAPHDERLIGRSFIGGQLYREFLPRREHGVARLERTPTEPQERYASYALMRGFPLLTVVSMPVDEVAEPWRRQMLAVVLLALAGSMLAIVVSFRLVRLLTELSARTADLEHLATTDLMTGASNRYHFLTLLYHEFARGRRYKTSLSVLILDLDFFKQINDGYGHAAGDSALQTFAATTRDCLREMDAFGRLGGEEFGILLPNTAAAQAEIVAERIRNAVAGIAIDTEFGTVRFTTSIGVTQTEDSDESVDVVLARADAALYAAKAAGRNRVVVRGA